MKLRNLKTVGFSCATLAALLAVVNKYTSAQAVTALETGTVAYAADHVGQLTFVEAQYYVAPGPLYTVLLFYAV